MNWFFIVVLFVVYALGVATGYVLCQIRLERVIRWSALENVRRRKREREQNEGRPT